MRRVEIVGNHSIEQDLLDFLDEKLPSLFWTKIPSVQGKGNTGSKLGDGVWPEENFLFFSVCSEEAENILRQIVDTIRQLHPSEGIFISSTEAK
jgi:hypothetical protein